MRALTAHEEALIDEAKLLAGFTEQRGPCWKCGGGPTRAMGRGKWGCWYHWTGPLQLRLQFGVRRRKER